MMFSTGSHRQKLNQILSVCLEEEITETLHWPVVTFRTRQHRATNVNNEVENEVITGCPLNDGFSCLIVMSLLDYIITL